MTNYLAIDLGDSFFGGSHFLDNMTGVSKLVNVGVGNAIVIAGIVLTVTIIYSGISMLTAAGNVQQFERARTIMTSAIIGFVLVVASWFILLWIERATGARITNS